VKKRKRVPGDLNDRLMAANRHTCCICRQPRHPVEKHHIDEDPSNNEWNNLAVVCRNCHGLISAKGNLGARYSPGEVLRYKQVWEQHCAEAGEDDIDSPVDEIHETRVIEGGSHEIYPFEMEEGDELVFSIDAGDPLDVVVCDEEDAEAWSDGEVDEEEEGEDNPLPAGYMHLTGLTECRERSFTALEDGSYVLLLVNWDDESTEVTIDAAVWEAEE
jgi:hypothetical protein